MSYQSNNTDNDVDRRRPTSDDNENYGHSGSGACRGATSEGGRRTDVTSGLVTTLGWSHDRNMVVRRGVIHDEGDLRPPPLNLSAAMKANVSDDKAAGKSFTLPGI